jgi:hypothetical protein
MRGERMFRGGARCNNDDMHLGLQLVVLMALTTVVGWLMIESGVMKNMLDRRRERRVCPSCGRYATSCGCF